MPGRASRARGLLAALALLALAPGARAIAVAEVSLDEMLGGAALVFEGEVVAREARRPADGGPVRTFVTFRVLDVVKGTWPSGEIELSYLGGVVDGRGLRVAGVVIPEPGERGIWFVESTTGRFVQPFYGEAQGEFRIVEDGAGAARTLTRDGRPVRGMFPAPIARTGALSSGVARGIAAGAAAGEAMTPDEFKRRLRERMKRLPR